MAVDQGTPQASPSNGKRAREPSPAANASVGGSKTYTGYEASLYPMAGPSQPKKKAKKGEPQPEQAEKRAKLYRKAPTKQVTERADRVRSQRFFCVARKRTTERSEEFSVLGSTGNVYTVYIRAQPACTCPDGAKGNHCKHIIFVFLKILQVPLDNNLWYQSALLQDELSAIFAHARPAPKDRNAERVAKLYRIATGEEEAEPEGSDAAGGDGQKRLPQEGDDCPICYEKLPAGEEKGLVFCMSVGGCGNGLHAECFSQWAKQTQPVTCIMCRTKWEQPAANANAGPSYSAEGYLNLGAAANLPTQRDTSSYYSGPQRGKTWDGGYGRYGGW